MSTRDDTVIIVGGGQSGQAAARAARDADLRPLILEAGERPVGSWPGYYDSLTLFSPARHSAMPGAPFPGGPDRYPHRDEVAAYLERHAAQLDVEIRTGTRVEAVEADAPGFTVRTADGRTLNAAGLIAASGSFANPHLPALPGHEDFPGELLHVADYRSPEPYAGKRVVVVGGGNSAVQVGYELSRTASTTLATRAPIRFLHQLRNGRDLHDWLVATGFDRLPPEWLIHYVGGTLVVETGDYENALNSGRMDRREMFTAFDGDHVVWADGRREPVDAVLFATGYRPDLDYLRPLGALDGDGAPLHTGGVSATHPGLVYAGLEFQRSFSSNTLRGVHRDAEHVVAPLAAHVRKAPTAAGL
ncbi:flavin-containing monooxygenase [Streptomonospora salina]|uniref:Putative flavoprotein involved in K+ transport n=1 Tax=Streptomonospora salina TaxID=104205 RepID=A0A841E5X5_9ACTN|nr:NAD(P)/FAD-dependent oxidoreductase [Streptomonospora salina]MBB5998192.1 putative flavoprotein involved in K+ transport [Streptomonospora salina]